MILAVPFALVILMAVAPVSDSRISKADARNVFKQYQEKSRLFDPALAELYCENGAIRMYREEESGNVRKLEGPIPPFKKIVREGMQEAKRTNDYSKFSKLPTTWMVTIFVSNQRATQYQGSTIALLHF